MDEKELVRRCLEGDRGVFQEIVDRYTPPLMAVALTVLGNRQDAEDLCQETFIQAFRHLARFDPERSLKTWLYTILYRRSLNMVKTRKRFSALLIRMKAEPQDRMPARNPGPPEPVRLPSGFYKTLSPKERTILSLWVNEGYRAVEIAAILGCSPSTARFHLFNVRKKIRSLWEKDHDGLLDR
jgi:RNA polymerase sigma-70 factor, ECF subfamily